MASLHNLGFYLALMREARQRILDGTVYQLEERAGSRLRQRL